MVTSRWIRLLAAAVQIVSCYCCLRLDGAEKQINALLERLSLKSKEPEDEKEEKKSGRVLLADDLSVPRQHYEQVIKALTLLSDEGRNKVLAAVHDRSNIETTVSDLPPKDQGLLRQLKIFDLDKQCIDADIASIMWLLSRCRNDRWEWSEVLAEPKGEGGGLHRASLTEHVRSKPAPVKHCIRKQLASFIIHHSIDDCRHYTVYPDIVSRSCRIVDAKHDCNHDSVAGHSNPALLLMKGVQIVEFFDRHRVSLGFYPIPDKIAKEHRQEEFAFNLLGLTQKRK